MNFVFIQYYFEKKVNDYVFFFDFKFCNEISVGLGFFAETSNCDLAESSPRKVFVPLVSKHWHLIITLSTYGDTLFSVLSHFSDCIYQKWPKFDSRFFNFLLNIFDMASPNTCSCLVFRTHHFIICIIVETQKKKEEFFKVNKMCGWIFVFVPQKRKKKIKTNEKKNLHFY